MAQSRSVPQPNARIQPRGRRFAGIVGCNSLFGSLLVATGSEATLSWPRWWPTTGPSGRRAETAARAVAVESGATSAQVRRSDSAMKVARRQRIVERGGPVGFRPPKRCVSAVLERPLEHNSGGERAFHAISVA